MPNLLYIEIYLAEMVVKTWLLIDPELGLQKPQIRSCFGIEAEVCVSDLGGLFFWNSASTDLYKSSSFYKANKKIAS